MNKQSLERKIKEPLKVEDFNYKHLLQLGDCVVKREWVKEMNYVGPVENGKHTFFDLILGFDKKSSIVAKNATLEQYEELLKDWNKQLGDKYED